MPGVALGLSWSSCFMTQCQAWEGKQGKSGGQVGCPGTDSLVQYSGTG